MTENNPEKKINLNISKDIANGSYNNIIITSYTKEEFVLDFGFIKPNNPQADIQSRIIITPKNAKNLADTLQENIKNYEKKFGPLDDQSGQSKINFSFN